MKFKNPETGELSTVSDMMEDWCGECCRGSECPINDRAKKAEMSGRECEEWINNHPNEAADLMGYEVVEDDHIPLVEKKEETNMDKPLKDWTLGEIIEYCEKHCGKQECSESCHIQQVCDFMGQAPCLLDLTEKPRFTQQEVERAKAIKVIYPTAYRLEEADPLIRVWDKEWKLLSHVDTALFPSLQPGQSYPLDEIIGGAE